MGVRTVLGAGRGRLIRQLLVESLSLAALGGIAGLALAFVFHRGLLALVADNIPVPRLNQVSLDLTVVMLTMGLSLLTGLVFGLVPAIVSARSLNDSFREGGRHGSGPRARRVLGTLVAAEVALSLVLLAGAGLLVRSFVRLSSISPGFRAEGLLTMRVQLPVSRYDTSERRSGFSTNALARIGELPGVRSAAGVTFLPFAGPGIGTSFYRTDQPTPGPGQAPSADVTPITPGFFRTMGIPHVMGRDFTAFDRGDSPPVAIVNETMVRLHLTDGSPIGKRLHVNAGFIERLDYEIVGVVGDIKLAALDRDIRPTVYLPYTQLAIPLMTLVVRTEMNPLSLAPSVGAAVHALDRELPLADVRTMQEVVDATLARPVRDRATGNLRGDGAPAGRRRGVRRDGVFRGSAHAGDWCAHGTGRDAAVCVRPHPRAGAATGGHRRHDRTRLCRSADPSAGRASVRDRAARSRHLHRDDRIADRRRHGGLLRSGPSWDENRACASVARRLRQVF